MKRKLILAAAIAALPILSLSVSPVSAGVVVGSTWSGLAGDGLWPTAGNWDILPGAGDPVFFPNLPFQNVDTVANQTVGTMTFNSTNPYMFFNNTIVTNSGNMVQNGVGSVDFNSAFTFGNAATVFGGVGNGAVNFNGVVTGASNLTFNSGVWGFTRNSNTFSGTHAINLGAFVALGGSAASPNVLFSNAAATHFGASAGGAININGGNLRLTTVLGGVGGTVTGNITLGRPIAFGINGGTLEMVNTIGGTLGGGTLIISGTTVGGGGGDLNITTTAGAAPTAIVKFNGGQHGLSNNDGSGNWVTGGNTLRTNGLTGTGALRIELTNGALYRNSTGAAGTVNVPMAVTIRGVIGGDSSSGPAATINPATSLTTGRVGNETFSIFNYTQGLTVEGAVQFSNVGGARALDGNIVLKGIAGGNTAYATFNGRGTGTSVTGTLQAPGGTAAGLNPLYIGQGRNDTLTVEDGAVASMDLRIRSDQANHNGVLLDAATVVNSGGILRFTQSVSNRSPFAGTPGLNATANVGYHIARNNIEGQGTTAKESVVQLYLPFANTATTVGANPNVNGVEFQGTNVAIIINGLGFGGLKVAGIALPSVLFNATDPNANDAKVANLLSATRLAAITGTGGYLTPAPDNAMFAFPAGGEWSAAVPVGLKVTNNNASGNDLSLPAGSSWGHNLHIEAGATAQLVNVAINSGVTSGTGTIAAGAGTPVSFGGSSVLSPGASPGVIAVTGDINFGGLSKLRAEIQGGTPGTQYDQLATSLGTVDFNSDLAGTASLDVQLNTAIDPAIFSAYFLVLNEGIDPIVRNFGALPEGSVFSVINAGTGNNVQFQISYQGNGDGGAIGNDVVLIAVVPEPASLGLLALAGTAPLGRRRRQI